MDISSFKRKKIFQNIFLNVYTFNIKMKFWMKSIIKESLNCGANAKYRLHPLNTKIHLKLIIKK